MTILVIARHGNTFEQGDTLRRVGARTDMALTDKGREQARGLGAYLKEQELVPAVIYSSLLKRTIETAEIAAKEAGFPQSAFSLEIFNEIDYGPDENKIEEDVVNRVGKQALKDWDEQAVVPEGWLVDPDQIIRDWHSFAAHICNDDEIVLVVTSNGIARFAPHITGDFEGFSNRHSIKIATGALCILQYKDDKWSILEWNVRP